MPSFDCSAPGTSLSSSTTTASLKPNTHYTSPYGLIVPWHTLGHVQSDLFSQNRMLDFEPLSFPISWTNHSGLRLLLMSVRDHVSTVNENLGK